ncbi:MAG: arginine--tRNA ligase, partial [Solirubrobacteraceae bacterium]
MHTNLFDYFEEVGGEVGLAAPWAARAPRRPHPDYDLKLVSRSPQWKQDPEAVDALVQIENAPWSDALIRAGDGIRLRVTDSWIEAAGAALEAGGSAEPSLEDLASGRRFSVQFWDPNATKALHIGHLRNLAIGNALASALVQAGGRVERRSLISDAGRNMGEAMAGVVNSGRLGDSWPDSDEKSDHFVGACYADYVASGLLEASAPEPAEDSLKRELLVQN